MNKKQSGFGAVELVMAVVIVVLLGVVGWLAWDRMQATASKTGSSTSDSTNTSQSTNTNTASINAADAESLVSTFYQKYTAGNGDQVTLIKAYGTASLLADYTTAGDNPEGAGSDPIVCAQALAPTSVTGHVDHGSSVDVTVTEAFNTPKTLTVRVVSQSGLKIDHVTCPQN